MKNDINGIVNSHPERRRVYKSGVLGDIKGKIQDFAKANPTRRVGAFLIDHMMLLAVSAICYALGMRTESEIYSKVAAGLIFLWFVFFFFLPKDGRKESRGIGKGILGLRLVNKRESTLAGRHTAAVRHIMALIPYTVAAFLYPYAALAILIVEAIFVFIGNGQRWVDFILGTQVVNDEEIIVEE